MRSVFRIIVLIVVGFALGAWVSHQRAEMMAAGPVGSAVATAAAEEDHDGDDHGKHATGDACGACTLPDFTELAARLRGSVVNISTKAAKQSTSGFRGQLPPGDPFEHFFGAPGGPGGGGGGQPRAPERSLGSGFVIDAEGYILTNNHVVENASSIKVKLESGEELEAKMIGRDPKTDVVLIKIEPPHPLVAVPFGDSSDLKVGEWVMAIGNPFGLEFSVTAGIVSAKGRFIGQGNYDDFIQTDTPINPGNSGGPLIDLQGRVVGINTSIFSRSGGNIGIGFAIPIDLARELIPQLKEKGKVVRGWMGVMIQKVTPELAESLGMEHAEGALVADVVAGGPAADAGIKVGDVIVSFDGTPVKESTELPMLVAREPIGKSVDLLVQRGDEQKTLELVIREMADDEGVLSGEASSALGLTVQNLTPEIAETLGLDAGTKGVLVSSVDPDSSAAEAGLRRGDLIVEVNRHAVADVGAYSEQIGKTPKGKSVLMLVRRGESTIFIAIKPAQE